MEDWQSSLLDPVQVAQLVRESYEADLGEIRAFLPARVPLEQLPALFQPFLAACAELPARHPAQFGGVRQWLEREFAHDDPAVRDLVPRLTEAERDGAMTALSMLGHTYRWDCVPPATERFQEQRIALPPGIAGPWTALARSCGHPRVGTTWSLHLCNWRMTDRPGGAAYRADELTADNVRVAHNWLAPPHDVDLDRFSVSFVLLEARGAAVLEHLVATVEAAADRRPEAALATLDGLHHAINAVTLSFSRSLRSRAVDPDIWLELVQPTFAWSAETDEPGRIEGGPSGMQVGTIQALDAALGVEGSSALAHMAQTGRRSMPERHRRFLHTLDLAGPVIRGFVRACDRADLSEAFNRCVRDLGSFRATHHARGAKFLRSRPGGNGARASTGLTIGVDDDPMEIFDRTMAERESETYAATLTCVRKAG
jgi:hypothetical protein